MSCVNSEVLKSHTTTSFSVVLTQEWLKWNEKSNCVFMLRDSREDHVQRFTVLDEADFAFTAITE